MGLLCPPPGAANPWGVVLLCVLPAQGTVPPPLSAAPGGSDPHPGTNPAPPQKQSFIYCVLSQARFCEEIPPAQPCPSITSGDSPHRERNPLAAGSPVCPQAGGEQQVPSRCRRVQRVTNLPPGGRGAPGSGRDLHLPELGSHLTLLPSLPPSGILPRSSHPAREILPRFSPPSLASDPLPRCIPAGASPSSSSSSSPSPGSPRPAVAAPTPLPGKRRALGSLPEPGSCASASSEMPGT